MTIPCRTRSFGVSTPPEGIELDLVFVDVARQLEQGAMIFSHRQNAAAYGDQDVRGAAVVTPDGGPDGVRRAEEHGAAAHIHLWTSDEPHIHEMIVTPIWGTPTPESAGALPQIPALSVTNADGMRLQSALRGGAGARPPHGGSDDRLAAAACDTRAYYPRQAGERSVPARRRAPRLVVRRRDGQRDGQRRAAGDGARVAGASGRIERGVVFAWWPGHSTGRYAGSTWFADNSFADLRAHCVGYFNIDSPGCRGATVWDCRYMMGEAEAVHGGDCPRYLRATREPAPPPQGGRSDPSGASGSQRSARFGCCRPITRSARRSAAAAAAGGGTPLKTRSIRRTWRCCAAIPPSMPPSPHAWQRPRTAVCLRRRRAGLPEPRG